MFFGKVPPDAVACFGSLPLSAAPKGGGRGGTHQHVLYDRAPGGGQQVRGQVTGCGERVRGPRGEERGGCCLYIIAERSSGKTSDGCPRRRAAE